MMSKFLRYISVFVLAAFSLEGYAKQPVKAEHKTFLDSMVFNYENTIWGRTPAVPLKPLVKNRNNTLPDLKDYGITDEKPMLSTERTIFVDSAYKVELKPRFKETLQEKDEHHQHMGVGFTVGETVMSYGSDFGSGKMSFSPGVHFIYEYYIYRNWGFMTGAEVSFTTGMFNGENYTDKYEFNDRENDLLQFDYKVGKIEEKNKLTMLSFPVAIAFGTKHFYAHGGLKVGVPVSIKYDQTLKDCEFKCYIPAYNTTITNAVALAVGDNSCKYSGKFSSSLVIVMLTLDGGYRFRINKMFDLMCGVFFDKALYRTRFKAKMDKDNVQYSKEKETYDFLKTSGDVPAQLIHSSVLVGKKITSGERIATGLGYTSFGLKVSFCYNSFGKDYFPPEVAVEAENVPDVIMDSNINNLNESKIEIKDAQPDTLIQQVEPVDVKADTLQSQSEVNEVKNESIESQSVNPQADTITPSEQNDVPQTENKDAEISQDGRSDSTLNVSGENSDSVPSKSESTSEGKVETNQ